MTLGYIPIIAAVALFIFSVVIFSIPLMFMAAHLVFCVWLERRRKSGGGGGGAGLLAAAGCVLFSMELVTLEVLVALPLFLCGMVAVATEAYFALPGLLAAFFGLAGIAAVKYPGGLGARPLAPRSWVVSFLVISAALLIADGFYTFEFLLLLAASLFTGLFAARILSNSVITKWRGEVFSHKRMLGFIAAMWAVMFAGVMYFSALGRYTIFPKYNVGHELIPSRRSAINSLGFRGPEFNKEKPGNTYRIAALGDSSTYGWLLSEPRTFSRLLENKLRHLANGSKYEVVNAGVPAYSLRKTTLRFNRRVLPLKPDLVILLDGANDVRNFSREKFKVELALFASSARKHNVQAVLCSYPFIDAANKKRAPNEKYIELNQTIKDFAEENNIPFLDLHALVTASGLNFLPDGHPNARGNAVISQAIFSFLTRNNFFRPKTNKAISASE